MTFCDKMKNPQHVILALICSGVFSLNAEESGQSVDPFLASSKTEAKTEKDDTFLVYPDPKGLMYFPKEQESYYTKYLAAMKEPSLMPQAQGEKAFSMRFTWLRSFHDPIAIRIWKEGEDRFIRAVRLTKQEDYSPGPASKDFTRQLTPDEWKQIAAITESPLIWTPLNHEERIAVWGGCDGARWIFERRDEGKYSLLDLWCPKDYGPKEFKEAGLDPSKLRDFKTYVRLGLLLLKISELTPKEDDIY